MDSREVLRKALAWHSTVPIRVTGTGSAAHGGILHGLNSRTGKPFDVYTEITGYAVSLYCFLARIGGGPDLLTAARDAADFLVRIQADGTAYPQLQGRTKVPPPARPYSFDNGVCVVGMARLAKATQEQRYIQSAKKAGEWLLGTQRPDGSSSATTLEDTGIPDADVFFGDGSCIHAKNSMAFLELHALTAREEFRQAAARSCEYTLTLQDKDGCFWSKPEKRWVFTHAHCYACEGLLFAGALLGGARYTAAAQRGIQWLAETQDADGGWLATYKNPVRSLRGSINSIKRIRPSDVAAQAARLFGLAGRDYETQRRAAIRFLIGCQAANGGFAYSRTRFGNSPLQYTWCTQFAIQALEWDSRPAELEDLF